MTHELNSKFDQTKNLEPTNSTKLDPKGGELAEDPDSDGGTFDPPDNTGDSYTPSD